MAVPKKLTLGVAGKSPNMQDEETRVALLEATIEHYLPECAKGIGQLNPGASGEGGDVMILHQDAFAAGYDDDEYTLLGMAMKYAGLKGVELNIIGKNHETF